MFKSILKKTNKITNSNLLLGAALFGLGCLAATAYIQHVDNENLRADLLASFKYSHELKAEINSVNELATNLKNYTVSQMAITEKSTIVIDAKEFRPDGTFCKLNERIVDQKITYSKPFDCKAVVLLSVTTNRLLAQNSAEKYAPHPIPVDTNLTYLSDGFTNSVTE